MRSLGIVAGLLALIACSEAPPWEIAQRPDTVRWDPALVEDQLPALSAALRSGDIEGAIAVGRERSLEKPLPDGVHHFLGLALMEASRPEEARGVLELAVKRHPGNGEAHAFLAEALIDLGELELAEAPLQAAMHLLPNMPFLLLQKGRLDYFLDRRESATQALLNYLPSEPFGSRAAGAHAMLARLAGLAGRPESAARHQQVSDLLVQANQFRGAHATRLAEDPDNVEALVGSAMINLSLFRNVSQDPQLLEQARGLFERAVELAPDTLVAHYNLGYLAAIEGRVEEAFMAFDATLSLDPDHIDAALNGAQLARQEGQVERAQSYLARVRLVAADSDQSSRFSLEEALLLEQMGQTTQAIAILDAALGRDPQNSEMASERARLASNR